MARLKPCPMRHEDGNCLPVGGFCTAVPHTLCEAAMQAYEQGLADGSQVAAENPPLTPDRLSRMGGEPYWHKSLDGNEDHWAILDPMVAKCPEDYHYGERWVAYARKR